MSIGQTYQNQKGDIQCDAKGIFGEYVIRKTADHTWIAIQLFGAIGSIAATALTPEAAFELAENHYLAKNQQRMKMTLEIIGIETSDLKLALNEALKLVSEGYLSGFGQNDSGKYHFDIALIN